MSKYIILTTHHDNGQHVVKVEDNQTATMLVEKCQRNLRKLGHPDGVTWKTYDGSLSGALIKSFGQCRQPAAMRPGGR